MVGTRSKTPRISWRPFASGRPAGRHYLISWHHGAIPQLVTALGAAISTLFPKKNQWPNDVYDGVIQLRYDSEGRLLEAKRIGENLMPVDADIRASRNR